MRNPETDRLGASASGWTDEGIEKAPEERLPRQRRRREADLAQRRAVAMATLERIWAMPVHDERSPDEIIGYDEHGLPS